MKPHTNSALRNVGKVLKNGSRSWNVCFLWFYEKKSASEMRYPVRSSGKRTVGVNVLISTNQKGYFWKGSSLFCDIWYYDCARCGQRKAFIKCWKSKQGKLLPRYFLQKLISCSLQKQIIYTVPKCCIRFLNAKQGCKLLGASMWTVLLKTE